MSLSIVSAGVDSLLLSYDAALDARWVRVLEARKALAARARTVPCDPRTGEPLELIERQLVTLGGREFEVKGYGAQSAPYLLQGECAQLAVNPAGGTAPTVQVKILSAALWREGATALVAVCDQIVSDLAGGMPPAKRIVSRVDVCVDFQDWVPEEADFSRFVTRGNPTRAVYGDEPEIEEGLQPRTMWSRSKLTGFRVGQPTSPVVVRLYDKTAEIRVTRKNWFVDVWAVRGWDPSRPVWRLEIALKREYLKNLHDQDAQPIASVEDVLRNLTPLWRDIIGRRVRLVTGEASRAWRSDVQPAWQTLADTHEIDGVCGPSGVTAVAQDTVRAEALVAPLRGYLAKRAALLGITSLDDAVLDLHTSVDTLCRREGTPFVALIATKSVARAAAEKRAAEWTEKAATTRARWRAEKEMEHHGWTQSRDLDRTPGQGSRAALHGVGQGRLQLQRGDHGNVEGRQWNHAEAHRMA